MLDTQLHQELCEQVGVNRKARVPHTNVSTQHRAQVVRSLLACAACYDAWSWALAWFLARVVCVHVLQCVTLYRCPKSCKGSKDRVFGMCYVHSSLSYIAPNPITLAHAHTHVRTHMHAHTHIPMHAYVHTRAHTQIPPEPAMENRNRMETLERLRNRILENLRNIRPVGASMHERPPDAPEAAQEAVRKSSRSRSSSRRHGMGEGDGGAFDSEDEGSGSDRMEDDD